MSKMDDLRAMREARYEAAAKAGAKAGGATRAKPAPKLPVAPPTDREAAPPAETTAGEELCGHQAISGRTCTREKGHSAKSHRYS